MRRGRALLIVILVVAVVLMAGWFAYDAYVEHIKQMKLDYDITMVNEAEDCATVQYLTDGCPGVMVYYYDATKKICVDSTDYVWRVDIEGYGMSSEEQNLNGETGAVGIPNLGGDDGAQLLAIVVKDNGDTVYSRWQGQLLTEYDLTLMTEEELENLTMEQRQQVEYTSRHAN